MTSINLNTSLTNTALTGIRQDNSVGDTTSQAGIPAASNANSASSVSISSRARELIKAEQSAKVTPATNEPGGKGYQIMVDRLFRGKEPPVARATGTIDSFMQLVQVFLTREDRALLADMYDYAQSQGADLNYVDEIAFTLGDYRRHNDGKGMFSFNNGGMYDIEGHQLTIRFDGEMAEVADRLLNGTALIYTRFDRGFLRYQFDPGFGALGSGYDPAFLEHMVNHFSSESGAQKPLDSRFAVHVPQTAQVMKSHYVISASDEVLLPPFEPEVMNIDGKWFITEKGRANGRTMEQILGIGSSRDRTAEIRMAEIKEESIRYLLDLPSVKETTDDTRPTWLKELQEMMGTDNSSGIRMFVPKAIEGKNYLFSAGTDS